MEFTLNQEEQMIQRTVRDFVRNELMPLEQQVLQNEREGHVGLTDDQIRDLQKKV